MERYGAIELGGTKTLVAIGERDGALSHLTRFDTGDDPVVTTAAIVAHLVGHEISAVGIASFGPLDLDPLSPGFGSLRATPKEGWTGHDLIETIATPLGVSAGLDTDVNAAALAEGKWGAARDLEHFAYVTVGTGVGAGIVSSGRLVRGLSHPEFGHLPVVPRPDDDHQGSCPYHGGCLEGMAAGPSVIARFGGDASSLEGADRTNAVELVAFYVAQGVRSLVYTVSPQRIVIGGGVSHSDGFHRAVRSSLADQIAHYGSVPEQTAKEFVVSPGMGDRSGLVGAVILARRAVSL